MTFSYETPPVTNKDKVRFYSGDTVAQPYSVSDEDIEFLLTENDQNVMVVAAMVCDRIADWWMTSTSATGSDKAVGPFKVGQRAGSDLEAAWRKRAAGLRTGSPAGLPILVGAVFTGNTDAEFGIGMTDNGYQAYPDRDRSPRPENGVW